MAHGNASDVVFCLLVISAIHIGFFRGQLFDRYSGKNADTDLAMTFIAAHFLTMGLIFSTVKWNPANGKGSGLGAFIAGLTMIWNAIFGSFISSGDNGLNNLLFFIYAAVMLGGGVHIFFF